MEKVQLTTVNKVTVISSVNWEEIPRCVKCGDPIEKQEQETCTPCTRQKPFVYLEARSKRNQVCLCGSGKKFKVCCLNKGV